MSTFARQLQEFRASLLLTQEERRLGRAQMEVHVQRHPVRVARREGLGVRFWQGGVIAPGSEY